MPNSILDQVVALFLNRLRNIKKSNGFQTDAGANVFDEKTNFDWRDESAFPAISLFALDEEVRAHKPNRVQNELSLWIEGHVYTEQSNPGRDKRILLADIKQAMGTELPDEPQGLITDLRRQQLESEPQFESGNVISFRLSYSVVYVEGFGNPYQAAD